MQVQIGHVGANAPAPVKTAAGSPARPGNHERGQRVVNADAQIRRISVPLPRPRSLTLSRVEPSKHQDAYQSQ